MAPHENHDFSAALDSINPQSSDQEFYAALRTVMVSRGGYAYCVGCGAFVQHCRTANNRYCDLLKALRGF